MDMEELGYFIFMEEQEEKRNRRMKNGRRNASRSFVKHINDSIPAGQNYLPSWPRLGNTVDYDPRQILF